ncbi:MAG: glycosyltransferase [Thermoanaerobaculia bacterium]|nr:glycosyltransferase [Thermoanaerobaculia bacterium]
MRLLHVVPTYLPAWRHGGPIASVHGLARALVARGHTVRVLTTNRNGPETMPVPVGEPVDVDGVEVRYFAVAPPARLARSPGMKSRFPAALADSDLLHVHSVFLWPPGAATRAARWAGVPYVVSPRGMLVRELFSLRGAVRKRLWLALEGRRMLTRAAAIAVTSDVEAQQALHLVHELPPLEIVPNGVDLPDPGAGPSPSPAVAAALARQPLLLHLGRVSWKKGLDRLIPALARLDGVTLAVAGPDEGGESARLARLARAAGVAERVLFLGPVAGDDKEALLRGATIFVLPSHSENFGNAALEALARGVPAIVTPEVGLAYPIIEAGCGAVVSAGAEPWGREIARQLADEGRMRAMGEAGIRMAREQFSWPAVAARMEEVYEAVLARRRSRRPR